MFRKIIYIAIVIEVILGLFNRFDIDKVFISEFFINYEGGFIRRGLLGHFYLLISNLLRFDIVSYHLILALICLLFNFTYVIIKMLKEKYEFYIFIASFFIIGLLEVSELLLFRHDIFLVTFFILQIEFLKILGKKYRVLFTSFIFLIGILIHEVYFLLALIPMIYSLNLFESLNKVNNKIIYFFPSFILFIFLITLFRGNNVDTEVIVNSWNFNNDNVRVLGLSRHFNYITNSSTEFLIWKRDSFSRSWTNRFGILLNFIFCLLSFLIYIMNNSKDKRKYLLLLVVGQYFLIICLSVIAIDYVRWLFLGNMFMLIACLNKNTKNDIGDNRLFFLNSINKYFILFIGIPFLGSWTTTQFISSMPIMYVVDLFNRMF